MQDVMLMALTAKALGKYPSAKNVRDLIGNLSAEIMAGHDQCNHLSEMIKIVQGCVDYTGEKPLSFLLERHHWQYFQFIDDIAADTVGGRHIETIRIRADNMEKCPVYSFTSNWPDDGCGVIETLDAKKVNTVPEWDKENKSEIQMKMEEWINKHKNTMATVVVTNASDSEEFCKGMNRVMSEFWMKEVLPAYWMLMKRDGIKRHYKGTKLFTAYKNADIPERMWKDLKGGEFITRLQK